MESDLKKIEKTYLNAKKDDISSLNNEKKDDISSLNNENSIKQLKESLKNLKNCETYLKKNEPLFFENLEIIKFLESRKESNFYSIRLKTRPKVENLVLKVILSYKREKEIKQQQALNNNKLQNKNIISLFGFSQIKPENCLCLVLEEAKFGNIRNFQKTVLKTFSESMLCFLASQILDGLEYCHNCKIAHMDIKPENIVVDEFLNFKIIDFSYSFNYKNKEPNEIIKLPFIGTDLYMPLEILESEKIICKDLNKVDLYSLGVTLYNLAFGCYPYNLSVDDEKETVVKKLKKEKLILDKRAGFSSYFLEFLSLLLEKNIIKRLNLYEAKEHYWVKGVKIIMDEKEKNNDMGLFLNYISNGNIKAFNEYINELNQINKFK